jgi:transposase
MTKPLLPDALWVQIAPLLPKRTPSPKGGRPPIEDRAALTGILFVLRTGIPWEYLPQEMGCGSGMTCWRRLREWQQAGVRQELHARLLDQLASADQLDWSRACLDSASVAAPLAQKGAHKRSGRPPRIAANRARSAILW